MGKHHYPETLSLSNYTPAVFLTIKQLFYCLVFCLGSGTSLNAQFDVAPLVILSTTPTQNALNVAQGSAITATFDQDMNDATINASTITVTEIAYDLPVTPINPFFDNFDSGTADESWGIYRPGEEPIQVIPMADAPAPLVTGGSHVALVQDSDGSYNGAAIVLAGDITGGNFTVAGDVYVYANSDSGSTYTGLVAYGDSTKGTYIKLVADFDITDNTMGASIPRFRLYSNRLDMSTFEYMFHEEIDASSVDRTEGWHQMAVTVKTEPDGFSSYTCYYDNTMIGIGAYIDSSEFRLSRGRFGAFSFFNNSPYGLPGYFDNITAYDGDFVSSDVTAAPLIHLSNSSVDFNLPHNEQPGRIASKKCK